MNKSIKILLLVVAILLAVGGIMAYYKTIVSPPGKLVFSNQYINSDKKDISKVKSASTDEALDAAFFAICDELDLQLANSFLTAQERDELLESFAAQYVPTYVSFCNNKFKQSIWNEVDLQKINSRVAELQALKETDNTVVIQGNANNSLEAVHNVIVNYYEAQNATYVGEFKDLQDARQRIANAQRYAAMSPINNCVDLLSRLNSVAPRMEQAHYAYLANLVEMLRPYDNYSQSEYDSLALSISDKLEEYKRSAKDTYGRMSDISELENLAGEYYSNASFTSSNYSI